MPVERFIDSGVFLHQLAAADQRKAAIADRLIREGIETGNACTSFQVVQECLNTLLHKAEVPLDPAGAGRYLEHVLAPLLKVSASVELYQRALSVQGRYGYGFSDALIIAAALEIGCTTLFSDNLEDGQRIDALLIRDPFLPDAV